jgi:hypothetical protein
MPPTPKGLIILTLLLCLLAGAWAYTRECSREPDDTGDESLYLGEAAWIAEHGGVAGYLRLSFSGQYPASGAGPLLAALAAPFATRDLAFIRPARLFKAVLTVLCLAGLFVLAGRLGGWERGAWLVAALALSHNWLNKAAVFTIDPIIYALVFLTWLLIAGVWRPRGRWLWAGAAFGLAYLAKGTSLVLIAGLMAAVAWRLVFGVEGLALLRAARFWKAGALFLAGAAVVAAPLLVQGTLASRDALIVTRWLPAGLWLDSWDQHLEVDKDAVERGFAAYAERHGPLDALRRVAWGAWMQAPRFAGMFAIDKTAPRPLFGVSLLWSVLLFALACRGIAREGGWARVYTIALLAAGFLLFAWFSAITYSSRFAATFGPVAAWYAAGEIAELRRRWAARRAEGGVAPVPERVGALPHVVIGLLIVALAISNGARLPANPARPLPLRPDYAQLMTWYDRHVVAADKACVHTLKFSWRFRFFWLLGPARSYNVPPFRDYAAFMHYVDGWSADYLIVERKAPGMRAAVFGPYLADDERAGLVEKAPLPGWERVLSGGEGLVEYIIYRRVARQT